MTAPFDTLQQPRPAYAPIAVQCAHCGAPLQVPDERAETIVCSRCDSRCRLTGPQRDALELVGPGKGQTGTRFDLPLGQSFRWRGTRYEVCARMLWVEENDPAYSTRVYVLYHPRRPLLFLDEYAGVWGLMHKVHYALMGRLEEVQAGRRARTFDGRKWTCSEVVYRDLWHIDGCLPWRAEVGDSVVAWEFDGEDGARLELEAVDGERELNEGVVLTADQLRRAMPDVQLKVGTAPRPVHARLRDARLVMAAGAFGLVLNGGVLATTLGSGKQVHSEQFSAQQLSEEATSKPFPLTGKGLVSIELDSNVDNGWMYAQVALVQGDDAVVHVTDADISYYHGVEGGESWSEGSDSATLWFRGAEPGEYRLHLKAVSGLGETESALASQHGLRVVVVEGAHRSIWAIAGLVGSVATILLGFLLYKGLKDQED
ncbi:MAG: DUF4178 domain-containing protein [Alphaproteobacteria bacterium]|nr:DUF4178 domain-containing protein [Alphaproteobacteria bacterium]